MTGAALRSLVMDSKKGMEASWETWLLVDCFWSNNRDGTQPGPSTENWIKDLLSMALPIRTRPSFPLSQSPPSGSFHKPLILLHQRADRQNHNHRKLTNLITWTTALSSSMKLWAMLCRAIQDGRVMVGTSDKRDTLEKGTASHFNILALRIQWKAWKGKKIWHWKMNSPG